MVVQRITMFKVNEEADLQKMFDNYKRLSETNKKASVRMNGLLMSQLIGYEQDGRPYILSCNATSPINDPRAQGYNLLAHTTFESQADVKYYDEECEAHKELKAGAKGKVAGPPFVVMWETP